MGQAAANTGGHAGHVHAVARRSHGTPSAVLLLDLVAIILSPAGRRTGNGIGGGVFGNMLVGSLYPLLLLLLLSKLGIVLLSLLAALPQAREDGHVSFSCLLRKISCRYLTAEGGRKPGSASPDPILLDYLYQAVR